MSNIPSMSEVCDVCLEHRLDVKLRNDPYQEEIYDNIIVITICDDCYQKKLMDI